MVLGWRRAFCTSVPKDRDEDDSEKQQCINNSKSPKISSRLGFFSNPSTPRLPVSNSSVPTSPTLHPKPQTNNSSESPQLFFSSNPSTPKSPSNFSLLKSTLRISTKRSICGICGEAVKSGHGSAIFTAECSHHFHFPCIAYRFKNHPFLKCPICNTSWKDPPLCQIHHHQKPTSDIQSPSPIHVKTKPLRVYDDDEPLLSGPRFNPIPESDQEDEDDGPTEFQGFFVNPTFRAFSPISNTHNPNNNNNNVVVNLIPEVSVVRGSETCVVKIKVKAPAATSGNLRPPVDVVALLQVGGSTDMDTLNRAMSLLISSLSESDRLSIVAFSGCSKRLMPLRRMTANGQTSARRVVHALRRAGDGMCVGDAVKKAVKVLEDRRHRNNLATIVLLSDGTRFSQHRTRSDVPVHAVNVGACGNAPPSDAALARSVGGLLSFTVQDLRLQIGFGPGSGTAQLVGVYLITGEPRFLGSGLVRLGDFVSEEERELLVEFTCPDGPHRIMSVRPYFKDTSSGVVVCSKEQLLVVPRPQRIERLRNLHVAVRAVAESRRLVEQSNDFAGAQRLISSARAVLVKSRSASAEELLEAMEADLHIGRLREEEKSEPLTPTSAWRAAEKLAKLAVMKKSLNRVSDLHGFENARF